MIWVKTWICAAASSSCGFYLGNSSNSLKCLSIRELDYLMDFGCFIMEGGVIISKPFCKLKQKCLHSSDFDGLVRNLWSDHLCCHPHFFFNRAHKFIFPLCMRNWIVHLKNLRTASILHTGLSQSLFKIPKALTSRKTSSKGTAKGMQEPSGMPDQSRRYAQL